MAKREREREREREGERAPDLGIVYELQVWKKLTMQPLYLMKEIQIRSSI